MHKKVYELLQEFSRQRPSSRHKPPKCFSSMDQKEIAKVSQSPKDKRLKGYVLIKLNRIQAEKKVLLSKKRKALLWYKMIVDKMVSPLIEYMPSIATNYHLSKLTDFRTYGGFSEISQDKIKKKINTPSKCMEEPLPILIKPEYKVLKCHKKEWEIVKKFKKARDIKNQLLNKYTNFKNKIIREPETHKKLDKKQRLKDLNFALMYDLFLKEAVESKVENLMPSIKAKNEHSNVYDFRFQRESEFEQCERHVMDYEEVAAAPNKNVSANYNLNKGLHRNKTSILNPLHTKTYDKTHHVTVKNKPHETVNFKKKEEKMQGKQAIHLKEENPGKQTSHRVLHKQNWAKSDNRMKTSKPEAVKNKPDMIKIGPNNKNLVEPQPASKSASGNQNIYKSLRNKENEDKKDVLNKNVITTENVSEIVPGNISESGPQDVMFKLSDNIVKETMTSCIDVTKISEEGSSVCGDLVSSYNRPTDSKPDAAVVKSLEESNSQSDHKLNPILDEPSKTINDSKMVFGNIGLTPESGDIESQNKNHKMIKSITDTNEKVTTLSECELFNGKKVADCLDSNSKPEENKRLISDSNLLKNTYLISFKVNDDEACLKTRSQIVSDEIKGDLIDLNIVLEEEKKARNEVKSKISSENMKHTNSNQNALSSSTKSDSDSQIRLYLPKGAEINKENKNITSVIGQDVLTQSSKMDLTRSESKMNSSKSTSDSYTNSDSQSFNENHVTDDKLSKRKNYINSEKKNKIKTQETNKENINEYVNRSTKAEGVVLCDTKVEQKKGLDKINSLELIGKTKKDGKVLKHQKVLKEKEKPMFNTITLSDKRKPNLGKTKGNENDEKYQEIINSVKKIINNNSNESLLERNKSKIALTGTKIKNSVDIIEKYSKTINELKGIISELPGGDNQQVISTENLKHSCEMESKEHRTNKNEIMNKEKNLGIKLINKSNKKIKRINLKSVKVVEKIDDKVPKKISAKKIPIEINLGAGSRKEDPNTDLKLTNSSRSVLDIKYNERKTGKNKELRRINSSAKNIKSDEVSTNASITGLTKTLLKSRNKSEGDYPSNSPEDQSLPKIKLKEKVSSNNSDVHDTSFNKKRDSNYLRKSTDSKQLLFEGKENNEYSKPLKGKSDLNMADNNKDPKRNRISPERNISVELETDLAITTGARTPPRKVTEEFTKETRGKMSKDQKAAINTTSKGNETFISVEKGDNEPNPTEKDKLKFAMERIEKSATNSVGIQRKIIKFTRKSELVIKQNFKPKSEDNLIKAEPKVRIKKETHNEVKAINIQNDKTSKLTQDTTFQDIIQNTEPKVEKKQTQPTGIKLRKNLKIKQISNENLNTDIHSSRSSGVVNTLTKSHGKNKIQVEKTDEKNTKLLNVNKISESNPPGKVLKKAVNRRLHQKAMAK